MGKTSFGGKSFANGWKIIYLNGNTKYKYVVKTSKNSYFLKNVKNVHKNHFCEHYVINQLEGQLEGNDNNSWYHEKCGTIYSLKEIIFYINLLLIIGLWCYYYFFPVIIIFNIFLFFYWEKIKRAWQWCSMAMPEKWRLKLARQQIKEIRKELESKGIII